jgi:hypothetical protein
MEILQQKGAVETITCDVIAASHELSDIKPVARAEFFHSGTPESAPADVLKSFQKKYEPIGTARESEALRYFGER